jgi:IS5 family transposase
MSQGGLDFAQEFRRLAAAGERESTTPLGGVNARLVRVAGGSEGRWADAAYHAYARAVALRRPGVNARLARRPKRHHPMLRAAQKRYNRLVGRTRAGVETTFATWKRRMGFTAIRYVGLLVA